jgi:hypothetical protein
LDPDYGAGLVWAVILLAIVGGFIALVSGKGSTGHGGPGPGASGAVYDLLNQDKRNAIELIVEEKAGARDPEDADGNLPDLETPKRLT